MDKFSIEYIYGDKDIDYKCSNCSADFKVKIKQVLKDGSIIECPKCKAQITVNHTPETKQSIKSMEESLKSLKNTLNNLGK